MKAIAKSIEKKRISEITNSLASWFRISGKCELAAEISFPVDGVQTTGNVFRLDDTNGNRGIFYITITTENS